MNQRAFTLWMLSCDCAGQTIKNIISSFFCPNSLILECIVYDLYFVRDYAARFSGYFDDPNKYQIT